MIGQIRGPGDVVVNMLRFGVQRAAEAAASANAWTGAVQEQATNYRLLRMLGANDAGAHRLVSPDGLPPALEGVNI